jgi:two-component system response regulator FixJ
MVVQPPTIFLVDDDSAVRDSLRLLLEAHGLAVKEFASGSELLQDGTLRLGDCLVCDVHMPIVSGLDLIEALARRGAAAPTILITGRADAAIHRRAEAVGAFLVLEKPFDGTVLIEAIDRAIEAGSPSTLRH